jgi:hypothetical protein
VFYKPFILLTTKQNWGEIFLKRSVKLLTTAIIISLLAFFPIKLPSATAEVTSQMNSNQGSWKIELKFLNQPLLNKPSTLAVIATPTANALNAKLLLSVPESFAIISGDLKWSGAVLKEETKTLEVAVNSTSVGEFTVNAYAVNAADGATFGGMTALEVDIGVKTSTVKELAPNPPEEGTQISETRIVSGGGNSIEVKGRLTFAGGSMAIKGAEIEVFDSDGILGAQSMGKGQTDDNGNFDVKNLANPFDLLELANGPDVFVMVYARNWVVNLRNNPWWLLGGTYSYKTTVRNDIGEHDLVDFGTVSCQPEQDKAWDIYNVLQASYWSLNDKTGVSAPQVKAFYKDWINPFRSFCFPKSVPHWAALVNSISGDLIGTIGIEILLQDIVGVHYAEADMLTYSWSHSVIVHEYGHYVMDTYADFYPPTTELIHEYDVAYSPEHAFLEGWAEFFSAAVRQWWGTPASEYRDDPDVESNLNGDNVEGAVAGVLWDIYDSETDNGDNLQMDFTTIWNVLTTYDPQEGAFWPIGKDHPWTIYDFFDGFRFSNPGDPAEQLVSILLAHGITIQDGLPPTKPNTYTITSIHKIGEISPIQTVSLEWGGANDNLNAIRDYLVYWVNHEPRYPIPSFSSARGDATNSYCYLVDDVNGIGSTTKTLSKGEWWVEIRSRDLAENPCGDGTFDVGPFCIGDPLSPLTNSVIDFAPTAGLSVYVSSASVLSLDTVPVQGQPISQTNYRIYGLFNSYDTGFKTYTAPVDLAALPTSGEYAIQYYSEDTTGQTETISTKTVILDLIPPTSQLDIGQPQYQALTGRTPLYVTSQTPFAISAQDLAKGIGVAYTKYKIINGLFNNVYDSGWQTYSGSFKLSALIDGFCTIEYYSVDLVGNVETTNRLPVVLDNSVPSMRIVPSYEIALQDAVDFEISAHDIGSGIDSTSAKLSIMHVTSNGMQSTPFTDLQPTYDSTSKTWKLSFDTRQLPDGYYAVQLRSEDHIGNSVTDLIQYGIFNIYTSNMLPSTENSKAGRTIPVKFTLRVAASIDPTQPFIYNQELTISIYAANNGALLQKSIFGTNSMDYRINTLDKFYITNFQTSKTPAQYIVKIYRGPYVLASFGFATQK